MLSVQGPHAPAFLTEFFGQGPLPSQPMQHAMIHFDASPICVVQASHFGEPGFDLIISAAAVAHVAQQLHDKGNAFSTAWVGQNAQSILRVEAGVPRYGVDFSEENLLLEVGLNNAVSFTKGCYLGQEVVERIRSRGHVNKMLVGLVLNGPDPARPGETIFAADKEVGNVTSSVRSPTLGRPIALGYVHRDFWTPGTELVIQHFGAAIPATVVKLPFIGAEQASVGSS